MSSSSGELSAISVTKTYGAVPALAGVSCSVKPGGITALVGPSGGGKSTLLRVLAMLEPPDAGVIQLRGQEFSAGAPEIGQGAPWPEVTLVFQQLFLWPHMTLMENIRLVAPEGSIDGAGDFQRLLELLDLTDHVDRYPNETSLGQRQRAALLRALVLRPKFLLLDEITSALDGRTIDVVARVLEEVRDSGVGILLVTHLLGLARRLADSFVFLEEGRVREAGSAADMRAPKTERFRGFLSYFYGE